jgi:hypothetical protein
MMPRAITFQKSPAKDPAAILHSGKLHLGAFEKYLIIEG